MRHVIVIETTCRYKGFGIMANNMSMHVMLCGMQSCDCHMTLCDLTPSYIIIRTSLALYTCFHYFFGIPIIIV